MSKIRQRTWKKRTLSERHIHPFWIRRSLFTELSHRFLDLGNFRCLLFVCCGDLFDGYRSFFGACGLIVGRIGDLLNPSGGVFDGGCDFSCR